MARARPGSGTAGAEDRPPVGDDLCLNKKIAERRMQRVCSRRCEDDLRVARDLDLSACSAAVGDGDPAQLDIILGETLISVCISTSLSVLRNSARPSEKIASYFFRRFERRLIGGRPELSARHVADVTERAPIVAGTVFAPAGDGDSVPSAVTAPAFVTITWYLPLDNNCTSGTAVSGLLSTRIGIAGALDAVRISESSVVLRIERRGFWYTLLEQQQGLPAAPGQTRTASASGGQEHRGQREKAHTLVMRHVRPDDDARLPRR